jgi:hypothetical protein
MAGQALHRQEIICKQAAGCEKESVNKSHSLRRSQNVTAAAIESLTSPDATIDHGWSGFT